MNGLGLFILVLCLSCSRSSRGQEFENPCGEGGKIPCDCPAECIDRNRWCDGITDCEDKSDELYCTTKTWRGAPDHKCNPKKHFTCRNLQCVPAVVKCDHHDDCKDGSDERNCPDEPDPITCNPVKPKIQLPPPNPPNPPDPVSPSPRPPPVAPKRDPEWPMIVRPQVGIYTVYRHPGICQTPNKKGSSFPPLLPFHFDFEGYPYKRNVKKAKNWLLEKRDSSYGWGIDTPRSLVALSLSTNTFDVTVAENALMRRRLKLQLGGHLIKLKKNAKVLSDTRLAMYINALMATCQDPRDVFGKNLAELLYNRTQERKRELTTLYPYVYITLCLVDITMDREDLAFLASVINTNITDEVSKDRFILATTAIFCFSKTKNGNKYETEISFLLDTAAYKLVHELQQEDGSFGSIYSTALAAQTFNLLDPKEWKPGMIFDYLLNNQSDDGSFGDMLATNYALPALSGRSIVHLRNTKCNDPPPPIEEPSSPCEEICNLLQGHTGPLKTVKYTLILGYPVGSGIAINLTIPEDYSFFDIMRIAECADSRFRFLYTENMSRAEVFSIAYIDNDPERYLRWHLYLLQRNQQLLDITQMYLEDIRTLIPENDQEVLYWYYSERYQSGDRREP